MKQEIWTIQDYITDLPAHLFDQNKTIDAQFRFILTQMCNAHCFFCHNEWLSVQNNFMEFELFKKIVDVIQEKNYPQRIRFTWWEPMLHPWLFDFIWYAKKQLPQSSVWMTTNGLLIKKHIADILTSWLDSLTVSLHSMDPKKYKEITKVDGLPRVLEWLEMLHQENFPWKIKLNTVVDHNNIDEIDTLRDFSEKNGFELKIMDILTDDTKSLGIHQDDYITKKRIIELLPKEIVNNVKEDRVQPKCVSCDKKKKCSHEASYLRISPSWIINPCLWKKEYDVPLYVLWEDETFAKWIALWLYRVKSLEI